MRKVILLLLVCGGAIGTLVRAAPTRSMLGAGKYVDDNGEEGISAADYIQDGLVAMWDGIENAGWGVHDPNAMEWVDLVGGEGNMVIPSNLAKGNDCLYTSARQVITMRKYLTPTMVGAINGGNVTVEFVGKCYCNDNFIDSIASIYSTSSVRPLTILAVNADSGRGRRVRSSMRATSGSSNGPSDYVWYINGARHSISCVWSGSSLFQFIDGISKGTYNNVQSPSANATTSMYLNLLYMATNQKGFNGEACAFRIYARVLTEEEILHNYEIDKERFNLP